MRFSEEVLMAYADDELDAPTRAAVDAAMASDPEIAQRIARHKALRNRFHSAFDKILDEPVPARVLEVVRHEQVAPRKSNVTPLRQRQVRRWNWPQWTAVAASLMVGVIAGRLTLMRAGSAGPIVTRGDRLLAAGALAAALSDQLASAQSAADPVRIGVSFRAKSGEYCRTFALRGAEGLAGLACRADDGWQLGVLARTESTGGGAGTYRQAASSMPAAVVAAVGERMAGEPLDQHAEAAARGRHWQP
ncbi:MAG: anti-sigma factor family protein [Steroidobacteraceae bacterium]